METLSENLNVHFLPPLTTFKDKRVIVRVDWNMPVIDGKIEDTSRFDVSVPFLKELSFAGAKIILLTHFGGKGESLKPVADHACRALPFIKFLPSLNFEEIRGEVDTLPLGDAVLLENVRMFPGEEDNIPSLATAFSSLGDVFINDAFSVSHREHASVVGVARNSLSYFGPTFKRELEHLTDALKPVKPAILIIGGAKISTKLPLIKHYLDQGIHVFIGGAMAHNVWLARGLSIGKSFYDKNYTVPESIINHPLLLTPADVVLETRETAPYNKIPADAVVVDCGEETVKMLVNFIKNSKTIIFNGPLGLYEKGWLHGTEQVLVQVTESQAKTYLGGGDTVDVAHSLHLLKKFTFVSLGGGAMLAYLASGTLPGIDAVTKQ
ncbi:MAG: pgk, phosphoglycerate kinase, phosphoglycerate kinase [Candidatus Nomurabacteria bacterium]|nr:pgk, phosphoglycerate kinase, phosphoglycerate kinase [Candidatus Nomurabacteria bacterium]